MRALWPKRRNLYHRGDVSAGGRERVQAHGQERVSALLSTNRKTSMADSGCAQGDNSRFTKDRLSPAQRSPIPGILPALITSLSKKIYGTKIVQKERTSSNVAGPRNPPLAGAFLERKYGWDGKGKKAVLPIILNRTARRNNRWISSTPNSNRGCAHLPHPFVGSSSSWAQMARTIRVTVPSMAPLG